MAFSPDGTCLASGSSDGTVVLWDVASGAETARLEGHDDPVFSVAFSPDGTRLAAGSDDGTVRLWDVVSGEETARLAGHGGDVSSVAFSSDGTRLASGGDFFGTSPDNTVWLWDVESGTEMARVAGHGGAVASVAFSPDGTRLALGSEDGTVHLQLAPEYRSLAELLSMAVTGEEIDQYAKQGQIDLALNQLKWLRLDPRQRPIRVETLNFVCWNGALEGHVERVLDVCADAVAMAPDDGGPRDSRGVALALSGDFERAIEDFEAYVAWGQEGDRRDEAAVRQRRDWIETLRAGENPFTPDVLEQLKAE